MRTDEHLVSRAADGCEPSFDLLIHRYENVIRFHANGLYAPGITRDDLVQAGRVGLLGAVQSYEPARGLPFERLARLAIHCMMLTTVKTALRGKHQPVNQSYDLNSPIDGQAIPLAELITGGDDPADVYERREYARRVLSVIAMDCSDLERDVAEFKLAGGSYAEYPAPYKTVDNALQRVRRRIAAVVG